MFTISVSCIYIDISIYIHSNIFTSCFLKRIYTWVSWILHLFDVVVNFKIQYFIIIWLMSSSSPLIRLLLLYWRSDLIIGVATREGGQLRSDLIIGCGHSWGGQLRSDLIIEVGHSWGGQLSIMKRKFKEWWLTISIKSTVVFYYLSASEIRANKQVWPYKRGITVHHHLH